MKRSALLSLAAAMAQPLACVPSAFAKTHQPGAAKLTVNFPNWQQYADIKDSYNPTERGQLAVLDQLKRAFEQIATYDVPDGDHLTLTFSDIHLAGDFEPWHGPSWDGVRIVKDMYPPRFKFTYQLSGANGEILKQGSESLVDMNFTMRVTTDRSDPLRYEKEVMRDWMGSHARM